MLSAIHHERSRGNCPAFFHATLVLLLCTEGNAVEGYREFFPPANRASAHVPFRWKGIALLMSYWPDMKHFLALVLAILVVASAHAATGPIRVLYIGSPD